MAEDITLTGVRRKFDRITAKAEAQAAGIAERHEHNRILAASMAKRSTISWSKIADRNLYDAVISQARRTYAAQLMAYNLVSSKAEADRFAKAKYPR
jgi:hypothetical protein